MKIRFNFRKVVSTLCALALTATLIPAATAAEHVFLEQDFTKATVGDFKPQAKDMGFNMIFNSSDYTMLYQSARNLVQSFRESSV